MVRVTRAQTRGPTVEVPGTSRPTEPEPGAQVPPAGAPFGADIPPSTPPPSTPPPAAPPPPAGAVPGQAMPGSGRFWVVVGHLAYLIPLHLPGLIVTLVIWAWRRKRDPLLDDQAREALNFQLTYAGLNILLSATVCLCVFVPVVWLVGAVLCIVAAVSAADGQRHRYPWILRLIR